MHTPSRQLEARPPRGSISSSGAALCVRVRWGECLLATHVLSDGALQRLTVGAAAGAEVVVPMAGRARFERRETAWLFIFTDGVKGELLRNGEQPLALGDLVARGLAEESRGEWAVRLGRRDSVRLEAGAVTVDAVRVQPARRVVPRLDELLDYRFLNISLLCAFLATIGAAEASFFQPDEVLDDAVGRAELTKLRHVVPLTPLPAVKKDRGGALAGSAGAPAPRPRPVAGGSKPSTTPYVGAQELGRELFAGLGSGAVFGAGGLSANLRGVAGTMVGAGQGLGGLELRGSGAGSHGGQTIGLGGLRVGTRPGSGAGDLPLCRGPKELCKAKVPAQVDVGPSEVSAGDSRSGCLSKELIRKVIHEHLGQVRYCYESLLGARPSLAGRVSVSFHVSANGTVDEAHVVTNSTPSSELGACLVSRARTWVFPTSRDMLGYTVTYPFVFRLSGDRG